MMVAVEVLEGDRLTADEQRELERLEQTIGRHLSAFLEAGAALLVVEANPRLYQLSYGYETFAEYCERRWEFSPRHRARLIDGARVAGAIRPVGHIAPFRETQVRPLVVLRTPEARQEAWERAVDYAEGEPPTEAQVTAAVNALIAEGALGRGPGKPRGQTPRMGASYTVEAWQALARQERDAIIAHGRSRRSTFNRTNDNVEWALWTWNPVTGCDHGCEYCYARDIANRHYPERFTPVFRPDRLGAARSMHVPDAADASIGERNVFVCSMSDLFGKWVPQDWIDAVFTETAAAADWNFLYLTKFPQRLAEQAWPANAWCGTSVDVQARVKTAERAFAGVRAGVRWLSCEPLLERLTFSDLGMFDWVVIGASSRSTQTPEFQPPWEWVEHLIAQARTAGCQVYIKPNLKSRPREYPTGAIAR